MSRASQSWSWSRCFGFVLFCCYSSALYCFHLLVRSFRRRYCNYIQCLEWLCIWCYISASSHQRCWMNGIGVLLIWSQLCQITVVTRCSLNRWNSILKLRIGYSCSLKKFANKWQRCNGASKRRKQNVSNIFYKTKITHSWYAKLESKYNL